MKALSIQQPWAWAILHAGKDVENRTWAPTYRGPILIHAGKKIDHDGWGWIEETFDLTIPRDLPLGGIVGRCNVTGYIDAIDVDDAQPFSRWFFGPVGWLLSNAEPLPFRPCRGQLGLFNPPAGPSA